jgi:hypothetical protein
MIEVFQDQKPGNSRLFYAGLIGQIGSLIGTLIVFPAVNIFHLLKEGRQC